MGIQLDNAVVIFDEAHNLVDAVNHIHSADVSVLQLADATHAIDEYTSRFQAVLTGKCIIIPFTTTIYINIFIQ